MLRAQCLCGKEGGGGRGKRGKGPKRIHVSEKWGVGDGFGSGLDRDS